MPKASRSTAYQFFLTYAGYSWNPLTETRLAGRRRCARDLAWAENRAREAGVSYEWGIDRDIDSSDFRDEQTPYALWYCLARDSRGDVFASLCGIDFGRDGEPWGDPYRRVVEAELAGELPTKE